MTQPTSPDTINPQPPYPHNLETEPTILIDSLPYWKSGAKEIKSFRGHSQEIWAVSFAPDGVTLASGGNDRFIRMWEYYLCYCEAAFREQSVRVVQIAWDKPAY